MNNPNLCVEINQKLSVNYAHANIDTSGVGVIKVLPSPVNEVHVQRAYTESTGAAASTYITEPYGTQYTLNALLRNNARTWQVLTNIPGLIVTVRLTLVDSTTNNEAFETLTTNGTTAVNTVGSNYKACNHMEILSGPLLTSGQRIIARANTGQNNIYVVIGVDSGSQPFYYNPVFMCANTSTGVSRKARMISIPQMYSAVSSDISLMKWGAAAATAGIIYSNSIVTQFTQRRNLIRTPVDGQIELVPGEWIVWYRSANSNALCGITINWQYFNA